MRALMQVPIRKAPVLQNAAEWSEKFHSFLALCLEKDPLKRAKIEQLLKHPFVNVWLTDSCCCCCCFSSPSLSFFLFLLRSLFLSLISFLFFYLLVLNLC
jgi:serine/threonine protein kinase